MILVTSKVLQCRKIHLLILLLLVSSPSAIFNQLYYKYCTYLSSNTSIHIKTFCWEEKAMSLSHSWSIEVLRKLKVAGYFYPILAFVSLLFPLPLLPEYRICFSANTVSFWETSCCYISNQNSAPWWFMWQLWVYKKECLSMDWQQDRALWCANFIAEDWVDQFWSFSAFIC